MESGIANTGRQFSTLAATDEEIIARFQSTCDARELDDLVQRHLGPVRRLVFEMVTDHEVADDLTQETFLRAIRGLAKFQRRSTFKTWLFRIAMNTVHSHFRRSPRHDSAQLEDRHEPLAFEPSPEQRSVLSELELEVEAALQRLTPKLRSAVVLTSLHRMSPREAAQIEGCSVTTMYWRVHQARKQLQQSLQRHLK